MRTRIASPGHAPGARSHPLCRPIPIGDTAGIPGITANIDIERIDKLTVGQAGIGLIEERSLAIDESLSQHLRVVE